MIRHGNASPPWETKIAGPSNGTGISGVIAFACPMNDADGQPAGFASNCAFGARLLQRRQPRRELLGEIHLDPRDVRLGTLRRVGVGQLHRRLAPLALLVFPLRGDREFRCELQDRAVGDLERHFDRRGRAFVALRSLPVIFIGSQLVGLNVNPGRLIMTLTFLICTGIPSIRCGIAYPSSSLLVVTVSAAVLGLTSIFARTTTQSHAGSWLGLDVSCSRSNGPAFTGLTIDRPNGAPWYFSVM